MLDAALSFLAEDLTNVLLAFLTLTVIWIYFCTKQHVNRPPRPWGLPVVGNLLQLGSAPHLAITRMGDVYGDVFALRLGSWDVLVINSLGAAREALVEKSEHFSSRPPWHSLQISGANDYTVSFGDYTPLQMKRKKALLRVFHHAILANADCLNQILTEESGYLNLKLSSAAGYPVDPRDHLKLAACRVVFRLIFGDPIGEETEQSLISLSKKAREFQENTGAALLADFMPWMRFAVTRQIAGMEDAVKMLFDFVRKFYEERKVKYEREEDDSCVASTVARRVYSFMSHPLVEEKTQSPVPPSSFWDENAQENERKAENDKNKERNELEGKEGTTEEKSSGMRSGEKTSKAQKENEEEIENQILQTISADIFGASLENISASLSWAVAFVSSYEELQRDLHAELVNVVGTDRPPRLHDKHQMPLMQATILETLRLASVLPISLPHYCIADSTVKGYNVDNGTVVLVNLWGINHDARYFSHPFCFEPYRFLDFEGQLRGDRCSTTLPFNTGSRSCAGNTVSKSVLFLLLAGILQKFNIRSMQDTLTLKALPGPILYPEVYQVSFTPWQ